MAKRVGTQLPLDGWLVKRQKETPSPAIEPDEESTASMPEPAPAPPPAAPDQAGLAAVDESDEEDEEAERAQILAAQRAAREAAAAEAALDNGADEAHAPAPAEESQPLSQIQELDDATEEDEGPPDVDYGLPAEYVDAWDREHVRLPCSPRCTTSTGEPLWDVLCRALHPAPADADGLLAAMKKVRKAVGGRWRFDAFREFIKLELSDAERKTWFGVTLPHICDLALRLPRLCATPLPLLLRGRPGTARLSEEQCACLLAHAFFCTLPSRNGEQHHGSSAPALPYFTFCNLHGALQPPRYEGSKLSATQVEKWRCFVHYFERMARRHALLTANPLLREPAGSSREKRIVFQRLVVDTSDLELDGFWQSSQALLTALVAQPHGAIEEGPEHARMLQVDFANKVVGGGVLRNGCVQEEIRFLISPELVVSRLLVETLADNEALLLRGFERFSRYTGYASSFKFDGPFTEDAVVADTQLVAIDAIHFGGGRQVTQYDPLAIERELNKAYIGFGAPPDVAAVAEDGASAAASPTAPVCTGNWGCGAFGGDVQLKAVMQLLAASEARRPALHYLTFGDASFAEEFEKVCGRLRDAGCTVGRLAKLLQDFTPVDWPPRADAPAGNVADLFGFLSARCDMEEAMCTDEDEAADEPPPSAPEASSGTEPVNNPHADEAVEDLSGTRNNLNAQFEAVGEAVSYATIGGDDDGDETDVDDDVEG